MSKAKNVLITGSDGFVGRHLLRAYAQQEAVTVYGSVLHAAEATDLPLPKGQLIEADITDRAAVFSMVEQARPDAVIHLAAQASVALSHKKPAWTYRVNVDGTAYLLDALRTVSPQARILLVGSMDEYGCVPEECQPISEKEPLSARSPYGESKQQQELLAQECVRKYGQDIMLVRSAPHVGVGQSRTFAIADWAAQVKEMRAGLRPHVLSVGNLSVVRDIADVRDVVCAYQRLLVCGVRGEVYNVGTGRGICFKAIPPMLASLAGVADMQVETQPERFRQADIPMLVADNAKLRACTGWTPQYTFEQTLQALLEA